MPPPEEPRSAGVPTPPHSAPGWAEAPEEEYVAAADDAWEDPAPPRSVPSGETVREDRAEAGSAHDADRPPTAEEEASAERAAAAVDPASATAYREAIERGASVEGEGRITG